MSEAGDLAPASGPTITARRADVRRLYLEGWTEYELANKLGVSQSTIGNDVRALGIARPTDYGANARRGTARRRAELEAYKRENRLLDVAELAPTADVGKTAIRTWAADGRLPHRRYPGAWQGGRPPRLFELEAVASGTYPTSMA